MTYEKIVTLYDTAEHAEAARRNLEAAGFPPSDISSISNKTLSMPGDKLRDPGLWHRLFGREIQQYEAALYGRSVEAGGTLLTIRVPETDVARATAILNAHQSVDVLKRAEQQGLLKTAVPTKPAVAPIPLTRTEAPPPAAATRVTSSGVANDLNRDRVGSDLNREEVIALAEEKINVAKRVIQDGTTRIRRFVTETPVEAQVTLHEEHARVLRRAITDPNYTRNLDWTDKTIEITETAEEPVVTKSAHVAEEVVIQREGSDHVKTVRDKVRKQEVEVEHLSRADQLVAKG
jgi:stress response protein YsnF